MSEFPITMCLHQGLALIPHHSASVMDRLSPSVQAKSK